jgi:hypothetical protein
MRIWLPILFVFVLVSIGLWLVLASPKSPTSFADSVSHFARSDSLMHQFEDARRLVEKHGTEWAWQGLKDRTNLSIPEKLIAIHAYGKGDERFGPVLEQFAGEEDQVSRMAAAQLNAGPSK